MHMPVGASAVYRCLVVRWYFDFLGVLRHSLPQVDFVGVHREHQTIALP